MKVIREEDKACRTEELEDSEEDADDFSLRDNMATVW
jgi:hypothetical protein